MGIHYPFGYVGYETTFLNTFIDLIDNFCSSCHTNDDVGGNCRLCPIGQLIYASKEYILTAYESKYARKENKIIKQIKGKIKGIIPTPHFNGGWIFEEYRGKDRLLGLRELLKDLQFLKEQSIHPFCIRQNIEKKIRKKVEKEMVILEKKLKRAKGK